MIVPRLTVMLVDDNPDDRALVERALTRTFSALDLLEVGSPADFQRIVDNHHVDVAILDYQLGWSTGLDILEDVRRSWPDCATIMFTDTGSEEIAVRALKRGLDDYLVKSVDRLGVLATAIQRALDAREQRKRVTRLETELRGLFDRLPSAIYRTTREGTLLYANPALLELLGYDSPEELAQRRLEEIYVVPEDRHRWFEGLHTVDDVVEGEFQLRRRSGEKIWVRNRGRAVRTGPDSPLLAEGMLEDITGRKQAEGELERQASFLALLQFVSATANASTVFSDALQAALIEICRRLEWSIGHVYRPSGDDAEARVLEPSQIWEVQDLERFRTFLEATRSTSFPAGEGLPGRVLASGEPEWMESLTDEARFLRARAARESGLRSGLALPVAAGDEVVAVLEFYSAEPRQPDFQLLGILVQAGIQLGRVAERERAERERERMADHTLQTQKMSAVGRLASGVAHDFNNLLTVIMLEAESALDRELDEDVRDSLAEIRSTGDRAAGLVRQLLTFSRQDEGTTTDFDLNQVVRGALNMLGRILGEDVTIASHLADDLRPVHASPGEFEQVLMNLVLNASDAMPNGGRVIIETENVELSDHFADESEHAGPGVLLVVSDTGIGMPERIREKIFEPFFTTKDVGKGTGLGLATVYGTVQGAGGVVRAYSEVGEGSTFKVLLPASEGSPRVAPLEASEATGGDETILVVEDEERLRNVTVRALSAKGYRVLEAADGNRALEILEEHGGAIDLLLTDVGLPGIRGPELARRAIEAYPGLPILLTSGYGRRLVDMQSPDGLRRVELISKPYSLTELIRRVRALLDAPTDLRSG